MATSSRPKLQPGGLTSFREFGFRRTTLKAVRCCRGTSRSLMAARTSSGPSGSSGRSAAAGMSAGAVYIASVRGRSCGRDRSRTPDRASASKGISTGRAPMV
eukprot:3914386-Pyramimonas_sp.AAC.1